MSVTDTTAPVLTMTRTGQANSAGDSSALMLKVYAGEVLTAFEQASVTMDKHVMGLGILEPQVLNWMVQLYTRTKRSSLLMVY